MALFYLLGQECVESGTAGVGFLDPQLKPKDGEDAKYFGEAELAQTAILERIEGREADSCLLC